jgi:4-hydroxy-tetrahydrodipicolinate reductase
MTCSAGLVWGVVSSETGELHMTYKVIQWGTGNLGRLAVQTVLKHPDLDLVGTWVSSADKAGRDVGDLCGTEKIGLLATQDTAALIESDADCVCYAAASTGRDDEVVDDCIRLLRAGKNVVNVSDPALVYPKAKEGDIFDRLQDACVVGASSFYTNGGDPGWAGFGLALAPLTVAQEVRSIRMLEIYNYGPWNNPQLGFFGFGAPDTSSSMMLASGVTSSIWGPTVAMVADAMGVNLDGIEEAHRVIYAEDDFEIASGVISKGTVSGMSFEIKGMVAGEPRIVVEHITKLRHEDFPEHGLDDVYRVIIEGEPNIKVDMWLTSDFGNTTHAGYLVAVTPVINAIPAVCQAAPGVLTYLDMPHYGTRGLI